MKSERCPVCKRLKKRSNPANARYWLLLHMIAEKVKPEGKEFSPESWATYFKMRYLGADEVVMPNGKTINVPKSSAELDTEEFAEYMMKCEVWAQERGVYMEEME